MRNCINRLSVKRSKCPNAGLQRDGSKLVHKKVDGVSLARLYCVCKYIYIYLFRSHVLEIK